ncbi:MAG: hypothetical protein DBX59_01980 [Bacillota bacterium]|nr:MAG: hypothetical protein DBX59_01980 [Bacillota bacterium]
MKTKNKSKWLISLTACAALALPLCFFTAGQAKAEPAETQYFYEYDFAKETENTAADFAMANGAALRRADNSGIRFIAGMKSSVFETVKGYENLELGVLIAPQDLLSADYPVLEDASAANITYSAAEIEQYTFKAADKETAEDYVVFAGSVVDITANNFNRPMAASAYYKYTGAEGDTVVYALNEGSESVRSLTQIALAMKGTEEYNALDEAGKAQIDRFADKYQVADSVLWTESEGSFTSPQFVVGESKALYFDVTNAATVTVSFADGTESVVKSFDAAQQGAYIGLGAYAGKIAAVTVTAGVENAVIDKYVMPKLGAVDFAAGDYSATLVEGTGTVSAITTDEYGSALQVLNGQDQLYTTTELRFGDSFLSQINIGDTVKFSFRIVPNTCDTDRYKFRSTWLTDKGKHFDCCYSDNWGVEWLPTNEWIEVVLDAEETQEMLNEGGGLRAYVELHGTGITNRQYIVQYANFHVEKAMNVKPTDAVSVDSVKAIFNTAGLTNFKLAPVSLNGEAIDALPANFAEGEHKLVVKISADGYRETEVVVNVVSAKEKVVFFDFEDAVLPEYTCPLGGVNIVQKVIASSYDKRSCMEVWGHVDGFWSVVQFAFTEEQLAQIKEGDMFSITFYINKHETGSDSFTYQSLYNGEANKYLSGYDKPVSAGEWITVTLSAEDTQTLKTIGHYGIRLLKTTADAGNCFWKMYIDEMVILKA